MVCGNMCGEIRSSPPVFVVIVTQLVTQRPHGLDTYLSADTRQQAANQSASFGAADRRRPEQT
jgi:hypothetical protein